MSDKHKEIIRSLFPELEDLCVDSLLSTFYSKGIITKEEMEELGDANITSRNRARKFLLLLIRREDWAFYVLLESCRKKAMPHLAKMLEDAGSAFVFSSFCHGHKLYRT